MISIQAAMLVTLGFLFAGFLALLIAPAYRRRAARLATEQLKRTMPMSEAEIRADKDRLRAEYAVYIHKQQEKVDKFSQAAARQRIELNRRDAAISELEGELGELRTSLDEHQNARRVLEQSIMDRLPKVEQRLHTAKNLLHKRDNEIATLTDTSIHQKRALEEAQQINLKQREEVHRLNAALKTRSARNRDAHADLRFDGEVALRSEIEALRAKTRDQTSLITRLQGEVTQSDSNSKSGAGDAARDQIKTADQIARLSSDLAAAETALREAQSETVADRENRGKLDAEIRRMKALTQDQQAKISELEAALKTYKSAEKDNKVLADSKMALKAQAKSLEAQAQTQKKTIESLRAELAAANERLARQAKHFMDEMRRIGAGTAPTGGSHQRDESATSNEATGRPSLVDRIEAPRKTTTGKSAAAARSGETPEKDKPQKSVVSTLLRSVSSTPANDAASLRSNKADASDATADVEEQKDDTAGASTGKKRRPGLMERITSLEKGKASPKSA